MIVQNPNIISVWAMHFFDHDVPAKGDMISASKGAVPFNCIRTQRYVGGTGEYSKGREDRKECDLN